MADVNDYLEQGIHGPKELKKAERKRFLGTIRERIVVALKKSQVREPGTYQEITDLMKQHPQAKLYLNGNMNYKFLRDYVKLADRHHIPYTMTTDLEDTTDIGLVLAYDYAIDHKQIFIEKDSTIKTLNDEKEKNNKKGVIGFFKNVFKTN